MKNMTKAERIYASSIVHADRLVKRQKQADKEFDQTTDFNKVIIQLEYRDDESLTIRTLNAMMKRLERDEWNLDHGFWFREQETLTVMRHSIEDAIKDIRDFQAFLKTI